MFSHQNFNRYFSWRKTFWESMKAHSILFTDKKGFEINTYLTVSIGSSPLQNGRSPMLNEQNAFF